MTRRQTLFVGVALAGLGMPGRAFAQAKLVPAASVPEAKGAPDIMSIAHLGVRGVKDVVPAGSTEGAAGPGEAIFVTGKNFGKKAEVTIAGQSAEILGRTADGGIVARVPPATPLGERNVVVKNGGAEPASRGMVFKRFAMVSIPKEKIVHLVELAEGFSKRSMTVPSDNPDDLRFSPDGSAGYVLDGKRGSEWKVIGVDMTAMPTPVSKGVIMKRTADVTAFLTARHAPVMVIMDTAGIEVFNLGDPLAPKKVGSTPLPKELSGMTVQTAEISPDGKTVAVLGNAKNRLVVLRLNDKGEAQVAGPALDVLQGATTEHAARAVRFSPDGQTVWIVSGENPALAAKGAKELTRLTSVSVPASGAPLLGKIRALKSARAPRDFVVTWGRVANGNFEARPPDDVAMLLAAAPERLFEINPKDLLDPTGRKFVLKAIGKAANPGLLYRMNDKGGDPVGLRMAVILLDVEVTPDTSRVVCFGLNTRERDDDVEFEVGVASAPAMSKSKDGILETGFIALTRIKPDELKPPFRYGEVRVQP